MKKCNDNLLGCCGNSKEKWQFSSQQQLFNLFLFLKKVAKQFFKLFLEVNFKCVLDFLSKIAFVSVLC